MKRIELGKESDIDELESLYNDLNDYLTANTNYPGWIKGVYPIRETAVEGIKEQNLFVLRTGNEISGSIILNHKPEDAYSQVEWSFKADYEDIIVIHTLVVHPRYMNSGVGSELMQFAEDYATEQNMKSIRLDVSIHNKPAMALYEKFGYVFVDTVDLGLNVPGLVWFHLYEKVLRYKKEKFTD